MVPATTTSEVSAPKPTIGFAARRGILRKFGVDLSAVRAASRRMGWGVVDESGLVWYSPDHLEPPARVHLLVDLLRAAGGRKSLYLEIEPDSGRATDLGGVAQVLKGPAERAWLAGPAGGDGHYVLLLGELIPDRFRPV